MQSDAAKLAPLMRSVIRLREMRTFALAFLLFVTAGCSIGVTVHDEDRASELIVDFLSSLKTDQGIQLAYDWTDDRFKKEVSPDKFAQIVSTIRQKNSGTDIRLVGYETFGAEEAITVYAFSENSQGKLYFKFTLVGTKHKDYNLLNFGLNDVGFETKGVYRDYGNTVIIHGV